MSTTESEKATPCGRQAAFNPFATATAAWIGEFLLATCSVGLRPSDRRELEDQIEALVPAVVELRDAGHIELNAVALASFGTLQGFSRLAVDFRLSDLSRRRCEAVSMRLVAQRKKAWLSHD